MELLKQLTAIHSPSGYEKNIKEFLLKYINKNKHKWIVMPEIIYGDDFQDCIILKFGKPKLAVFAHMDTVGFHVKYGKNLIQIGFPALNSGTILTGNDKQGKIECELKVSKKTKKTTYVYNREIERGTSLTYKPDFRLTKSYVQSPYLDNRLGVWILLKLAESIKNGLLIFTSWEEHGGGSVGYLSRYIYDNYNIKQALISDITWVTKGVKHGKGVAISQRDRYIPRFSYFSKIKNIADKYNIPYQIEVEDAGGSDGSEIQRSPYPIDWCFIGAAENNVHSPNEKVHLKDIESMFLLYQVLLKEL